MRAAAPGAPPAPRPPSRRQRPPPIPAARRHPCPHCPPSARDPRRGRDNAGMHIHILGIGGTFMGGLAALAREAGHRVTG
ncbi:Mur ligase domain-containing protein, partial [uncultured Tepidimonas sp.]|uniref:Mur ligase domain-containing protein n=1 Tax=uncultured Tepidimonas sp. TaxID=453579 RepID=UPI00262B59AC